VPVVCYNFMPLVDCTRTNLKWRLPSTGYALRFDAVDFAACDLFLLERPGAELNYAPERVAAARARFNSLSKAQKEQLERAVIAGLPGAESSYDRNLFRRSHAEWGLSAAARIDRASQAVETTRGRPKSGQRGVILWCPWRQ